MQFHHYLHPHRHLYFHCRCLLSVQYCHPFHVQYHWGFYAENAIRRLPETEPPVPPSQLQLQFRQPSFSSGHFSDPASHQISSYLPHLLPRYLSVSLMALLHTKAYTGLLHSVPLCSPDTMPAPSLWQPPQMVLHQSPAWKKSADRHA